jgi:hypothetical protein
MKNRGGRGDFERERQFQVGALVDKLDRNLGIALCNLGIALCNLGVALCRRRRMRRRGVG